ncbi:hypothetical protein ACFL0Q_07945 [Thermodesulfobacteriota bacterium]
MVNLSIFCADVGSIKGKRFGWAALLPRENNISGASIEEFAELIAMEIRRSTKVAVGFECPLFVPVRDKALEVNAARKGEGNRPWSAAAGTGALSTGLVEVLWVMNEINRLLAKTPSAIFQWAEFLDSPYSVFLWEAFVTSTAKGTGHSEDAQIAVSRFKSSLPDPWSVNAIQEDRVLSLVGAAALRAGWSKRIDDLSKPCLVIRA